MSFNFNNSKQEENSKILFTKKSYEYNYVKETYKIVNFNSMLRNLKKKDFRFTLFH